MRYQIFFIIFTFAMTLGGCAEINTALQGINDSLATTNNVLSSASGQNSKSALVGIKEQDFSKVVKPLPNKIAEANMKEAMPTINKALSIIACGQRVNARSYETMAIRYGTSDSNWQAVFLPVFAMDNHRSGCVDIERVDGYQQIAKNAFRFNALYVSPQSGESRSIQYKMIKEPSGEWLFKF